jgi:hypothetical protein
MGRTDNVGRFFRARPWARCRAVAYSVARCRRCLGPRARLVSRIQCALTSGQWECTLWPRSRRWSDVGHISATSKAGFVGAFCVHAG